MCDKRLQEETLSLYSGAQAMKIQWEKFHALVHQRNKQRQ